MGGDACLNHCSPKGFPPQRRGAAPQHFEMAAGGRHFPPLRPPRPARHSPARGRCRRRRRVGSCAPGSRRRSRLRQVPPPPRQCGPPPPAAASSGRSGGARRPRGAHGGRASAQGADTQAPPAQQSGGLAGGGEHGSDSTQGGRGHQRLRGQVPGRGCPQVLQGRGLSRPPSLAGDGCGPGSWSITAGITDECWWDVRGPAMVVYLHHWRVMLVTHRH